MGMDWAQLVSLIPALGAIKQGGPEFNAFMQAYQAADQQAFGQDQEQQGMDLQQERWAAQDARMTAQDARQAQQDTFARDRALRQDTQGNIGELLAAMPGMADSVVSAPKVEDADPMPFFGIPRPTMAGAYPEQAVQGDVNSFAELIGSPELGPKMAPFVGPTVSRAQKAQQARRRKAIKDAVDLAEKRQTPETLQQAGAYITVALEDGSTEKIPYTAALDELQMPPVTVKPPKPESAPAIGSFEDFVVTAYGPRPTADQIKQARKEYGDAGRVSVTMSQGGTDLTPGGLDATALMYLKTGNLPPLGMGAAAVGLRQKIINRAAELMPGLDIAGNQAGYKADSATLTLLTKRVGATRALLEQAKGSLKNAEQAAMKMPRSQSPLVNRYKQFITGQTLSGDPRLARLEVFIYSAARDYARVTSGGAESVAALTDAANAQADELLNAAQTPEAFSAALESMRVDMNNAVETLVAERDLTQEKIRTTPGSKATTPESDYSGPFWQTKAGRELRKRRGGG